MMRTFTRVLAMTLLVALVAGTAYLAGFGTNWLLAVPGPATASEASSLETITTLEERFQVFWEAWDVIQREFYGHVPDGQEMTYGAIRGMIDTLDDPNTAFLDAKHAAIFNSDLSGTFEGIGATVHMTKEGQLTIVRPLPGHPAEKAGLKAGDIVLEVDDVVIENMTIFEAIALIRGPKDTPVTLTILRLGEPEPLVFTIVRATIEIPVVESRMLDEDLAYVKLSEFNGIATSRMRETLRELLAEEPRGLILDLRGNPGGYLHVVVEITSEFIDDGLVLIEESKDGSQTQHAAITGGMAREIPLVVLIDERTASASEIMAGAIQDHQRGTLMGETTFGKGSVQVAHTLSDGSSLRVTIRHWLTPNGREINGVGLTPDIEVELTETDREEGRDPQLEQAVEYLLRRTRP